MTWESLRDSAPRVIAGMPCRFDIAAIRRDLRFLSDRPRPECAGHAHLTTTENQPSLAELPGARH